MPGFTSPTAGTDPTGLPADIKCSGLPFKVALDPKSRFLASLSSAHSTANWKRQAMTVRAGCVVAEDPFPVARSKLR